MRLFPMLLGLPLLVLQAHAQTVAPVAAAPAPAAAAPAAHDSATPKHHRMTWKEHFAAANVAHDGHLTLQEAQAGYPTLVRHFTEIDADKKGYVTEEDIANWHKMQRAMHHANHGQTGEGLRPRQAIQRGSAPQPLKASTHTTMLPMAPTDTAQTGQQTTAK